MHEKSRKTSLIDGMYQIRNQIRKVKNAKTPAEIAAAGASIFKTKGKGYNWDVINDMLVWNLRCTFNLSIVLTH